MFIFLFFWSSCSQYLKLLSNILNGSRVHCTAKTRGIDIMNIFNYYVFRHVPCAYRIIIERSVKCIIVKSRIRTDQENKTKCKLEFYQHEQSKLFLKIGTKLKLHSEFNCVPTCIIPNGQPAGYTSINVRTDRVNDKLENFKRIVDRLIIFGNISLRSVQKYMFLTDLRKTTTFL